MILVFATPIQDPPQIFFGFLPSRAVIHSILFIGFTHTALSTLKKQLKYDKVRSNATFIVLGVTVAIAIISELLMVLFNVKDEIGLWNLLFDVLGVALGIGVFKLLYRSCC